MPSVLRGIPASPGIVVGPVYLLRWEVPEVRHRVVEDAAIDGEIVRFHADDLKATHNMEYHGEEIKAELEDLWSSPDGSYSELYPSEAFKKFATKKTFAKLIYRENESEDQKAAS